MLSQHQTQTPEAIRLAVWQSEYNAMLIKSALHFLRQDLFKMAFAKRLYPVSYSTRADYKQTAKNCQRRYAFVQSSLSLKDRAKYQRMMSELCYDDCRHLALKNRFPAGYKGTAEHTL